MMKYLKIWWLFASSSIQTQMVVRWALFVFLIGKILRFGIFTFFIIILVSKTKVLAGYNIDQAIFFFLTFNLIDVSSQLIFREVYRFRPAVVEGTFDFYLIKPYNALFRALTSSPDILDLVTLVPLLGAIVYFLQRLHISDPINIFIYLILIVAGFVIALAFHILVLCLALLTTEIDHALWIYRDISAMGRFPIDIYKEPVRGILTFALPVGLMMSFPVKALLGLLSPILIVYAILFSVAFLYLALRAWKYSIKQYSSASS